jgi:hypothetical protein
MSQVLKYSSLGELRELSRAVRTSTWYSWKLEQSVNVETSKYLKHVLKQSDDSYWLTNFASTSDTRSQGREGPPISCDLEGTQPGQEI